MARSGEDFKKGDKEIGLRQRAAATSVLSEREQPEKFKPTPSTAGICYRLTNATVGYLTSAVSPCFSRFKKRTFPGAVALQNSDHLFGEAWGILSSKDGTGGDSLIMRAAGAAQAANQACYWHMAADQTVGMLLIHINDIIWMFTNHLDDLILDDETGSYKLAFGNTIFSKRYKSKEWQADRSVYTHNTSPNALKGYVAKMQKIAQRYEDKIDKAADGIVDVKEFADFITMDMISQLMLGIEEISDETKRACLSRIEIATTEMATHKAQTAKKHPWFVKAAKARPFQQLYRSDTEKLLTDTTLEKVVAEGNKILSEQIIQPNKESILASRGLLNTQEAKQELDLESPDVINKIKEAFVAGSETTRTLLLSILLLLNDPNHKKQLEKVQEELDNLEVSPDEWTKENYQENIKKIPYFCAMVDEALRLYSPVPHIVYTVRNAFAYQGGMLRPGDLIAIPPQIIHRLKSEWGEAANEFRPERFLEENQKTGQYKKPTEYNFCPFGLPVGQGQPPKHCPGKPFAKQEATIIAARLFSKYNMESNLNHPFPAKQVFTLRFMLDENKNAFYTA